MDTLEMSLKDVHQYISMGWRGTKSLYSLILKGIALAKKMESRNSKYINGLSAEVKEKVIYTENELTSFLSNVKNSDLINQKIFDREELNDFLKLCKESGTKVLVMSRPMNFESILQKANRDGTPELVSLNDREKQFLQQFSKFDERTKQFVSTPDAHKIVFALKDADKMKLIAEQLQRNAYEKAHGIVTNVDTLKKSKLKKSFSDYVRSARTKKNIPIPTPPQRIKSKNIVR